MSIRDRLALRPVSRSTPILARLRLALEVRRQRRALAEIPADRLKDIGLTEDEVRREVARPVWDVPRRWLR